VLPWLAGTRRMPLTKARQGSMPYTTSVDHHQESLPPLGRVGLDSSGAQLRARRSRPMKTEVVDVGHRRHWAATHAGKHETSRRGCRGENPAGQCVKVRAEKVLAWQKARRRIWQERRRERSSLGGAFRRQVAAPLADTSAGRDGASTRYKKLIDFGNKILKPPCDS